MAFKLDSESVKEALNLAKSALRCKGIESWALDADLIMMKAAGLERTELVTKNSFILSPVQISDFENYINRRLKHEPVSYITNKSEFMGLEFFVDKNVLIPRPETECIVERVIEYVNKNNCKSLLDMCTGSGCIAVSMANYCHMEIVAASDISPKALETASKNAVKNGVNISLLTSDMFENIKGTFDIIISNPPYIKTEEIEALSENVKFFEPRNALDGGQDGLEFYRIIAGKSKDFLADNGRIFLEIGCFQANDVIDIFMDFKLVEIIKDLAGLDRGLCFSK